MSVEELVRDTAEMTKRMELKWDIISAVLIVLCAGLLIVGIRLIWEEYRDRKEKQTTVGGNEYRPQVLPDVQIGPDGTEYHRMGVPGKEI